jgi:hypothetical protein
MVQLVKQKPDRWWTWRWDTVDVPGEAIHGVLHKVRVQQLTRWRRGSLLTVYRIRSEGQTFWLLCGPFNFSIGFGVPWARRSQDNG